MIKKATVEVERPNGTVETVATTHSQVTPRLFGLMKDATAKAGRGRLISYSNPAIETEIDEMRCERCGTAVDDTAYSQVERAFGSPYTAHYCAGCERVLKAVGAGEQTAMDNRREAQTMDLAHKEDE